MQATASTTIEREIRIGAPPETVYSYFTDPEKMTQWMAMKAEADPRPGGALRWDMNGFDIARGEFLELVPFSRIVFTWGWESLGDAPGPGSTRIEVTLLQDGTGTILRLVHSGLDAASAEAHGQGWDHFMPRLADAAGSGSPAQPRPEALTEPVELASKLNSLLCELRAVLDATTDEALQRRTPGSGWNAAVTIGHMISHLALAQFAADTAAGTRSPIADLTLEQLNANNATLVTAEAEARAALLTRLKAEGPVAVETMRALKPAALDNGQPMAFAGGNRLTARDLIQAPLLGDVRAHLDDVRAALD